MRKIEVCCGCVADVRAAVEGGAIRVELCSALGIGGLTPSYACIKSACQQPIAVNVLIRPREGDFIYSEEEINVMIADIEEAKRQGACGVVVGALTLSGDVDLDALDRMVKTAKPELTVTFHRAFDVCNNPYKALEEIIAAGCDRILTSGQEDTALAGSKLIAELVKTSKGRIVIMPGAGVNPENISKLESLTGAEEFHSSATNKKEPIESKMHPDFGPNPRNTSSQIVAKLVNTTHSVM